MKLAYLSGIVGPISIEDDDFEHFLEVSHSKHPGIRVVDVESQRSYVRKLGSHSRHGEDVWIEDPHEIEIATKYNRYPLVDMRYLSLFFRNRDLYEDCIVRKTRNINEFLNFEDKINLIVNILLGKQMNLKEMFSIIQQPPSDEELSLYMQRLAYVILEEQRMNGEIADIEALKNEAIKLACTKSTKEELDARSVLYQNYMRYLLTKDDYINITEQELKFAENLKSIALDEIERSENRVGMRFLPYKICDERIISNCVRVIKCHSGLSVHKGKICFSLFKYVDEVINDPKDYLKKSRLLDEVSLLMIDEGEFTNSTINVVIADKNYCFHTFLISDPNKLKKRIDELNVTLNEFSSFQYGRKKIELISL